MPPTTAARWMTTSGARSAYIRCDVRLARQVVVRLARHEHVRQPRALERRDDVAAEKAAAAGDDDSLGEI